VNLSADESLLTGESVPVRKRSAAGEPPPDKPGGDDLPLVFSGSLITAGQGVAEVLRVGFATELGRIGKALQGVEQEETLLQKETGRLVRNLAIAGLSLCAVVVLVYGLSRGGTLKVWQDGFLAGITMAMAILPEEFPVVLTIFLALGAWRISRFRVLTRRMPAVETLGAATVLCTDKTGTLTLNQMSVRKLDAGGAVFDTQASADAALPEEYHRLLEYAVLASKRDPFDPMEKALTRLGDGYLASSEHLHQHWDLVQEYPLSPELLALSHVWQSSDGDDFRVAAKGAPEAIADLCHLDPAAKAAVLARVAALADTGLRVLAVASARFSRRDLPDAQHAFEFHYLGLVGLEDPVRPAVPAAISECYTAGIRVIMITGDYPGTARSIARQIGLSEPESVITGPELDAMSDEELARRIRAVNIFARVVPEQKLRLVKALKANGEIVAMTGDGVNDAPALKAAHIGAAMGGRGTDVAREASALVLLDDDFSSIVQAVKMGRRIFDNIKNAIAYILAVHIPIAGLSMIPVFIPGWPLLLLPVHVLFLELIIDPSCSVIFEAENAEPNVMKRPPRNPRERLFNGRTVVFSLLQGAGVLGVILGVLAVSRMLGHEEEGYRRAMAFTTLVIANVCLILSNRSWTRSVFSMLREPNRAVWWVVGGALAGMSAILNVPGLRNLFHFNPIDSHDLLLCIGAGAASILWFELFKLAHPGRWVSRSATIGTAAKAER
jgi:Ca2+-transporting ATPase